MLRLWLVALCAGWINAVLAQPAPKALSTPTELQPPSPTPPDPRQDQQPKSGQEKTVSSNNERGTDPSPPVVKTAPSPDAYPETQETRAEREEKAFEDWWTFIAVVVTAGATVVLATVTGGLWIATWRLYRTTATAVTDGEKAIKAATDAANAANTQAKHLEESVAEARRGADAMRDVANAANSQANTASQSFNKLERPYLFPIFGASFNLLLAHNLQLRAMYDHPASAPRRYDFQGIWAEVQFHNYGRTPGVIKYAAASIVIGEQSGFAMPRLLDVGNQYVLYPGDKTGNLRIVALEPADCLISAELMNRMAAGEVSIWVYGSIMFEDILDTAHRTHFCWGFDCRNRVLEPSPQNRNYTESFPVTREPLTQIPPAGGFRSNQPMPSKASPPATIIPM